MARPRKEPGTALTTPKSTLPVDMNKEMADEVAALASRLAKPTGDRISITKAGTFKTPDGQELELLEAIIVDFVSTNSYYDKPYVKGQIDAPVCFAIGLEPTMMVPSPNSPDILSETCATCWANQFGSHPNGKGKACSNSKLLALLPPDADTETTLQTLKVPATSIKNFDSYVGSVARAFQRPVRAVVTEITSDSDIGWENAKFGNPRPCTKEQLLTAHSRKTEAMERLMVEPDIVAMQAQAAAAPAPTRGRPGKPAGKPAPRGRPAARG